MSDIPAVSRKQQIAAIIAERAKQQGLPPKPGTASAQMYKGMSAGQLKDFTVPKPGGFTPKLPTGPKMI